ncbi:hypothetical protein ACOMHN_043829 [Nucella lapillus]
MVLKSWIFSASPDKSARKYLIYWRAETCARNDHRKLHRRLETSATSHDQRFILYNLQPECEYAVRVHPVNRRGLTGAATVTNFITPPCHVIDVRQGEPPTCHTADPPGQVEGLHSETSGCVTLIRWQPPSSQADDVEGYDVMWGETEAGVFSRSTVIYTSPPRQLSVAANVSVLEVGGLRGGQHYSVQVRARSAAGSSPPALLHLTASHPAQLCAAPSANGSHGATGQADHHSHSAPTSPPEEAGDASNKSDVIRGHVSAPSPVSSGGDVSDVTDNEGGGDVSEDSVEGRGGERDRGTSPHTPPLTSSSTKDFTDGAPASRGEQVRGKGSHNTRTESVVGDAHGGELGSRSPPSSHNATADYPAEGSSLPQPDNSLTTGRGAAAGTLKSSRTLVVCLLSLLLCLRVRR